MDKDNFDDNNNKRYKGDHHHRNQDANIIYESLKQDNINLILRDALHTTLGEVSEIWHHFFKFNFFNVIFLLKPL